MCVCACLSLCVSETLEVVVELTLQAALPQKSQLHIASDPVKRPLSPSPLLFSPHLIGSNVVGREEGGLALS